MFADGTYILLVSTPVALSQPWCPTSIWAPAVSPTANSLHPCRLNNFSGRPNCGQTAPLGGSRSPSLAQLPLSHFRHLLFKLPLIDVPLWSDHLPLLDPCCRHNCTSRLPNCPSDWLNCPRDWSKSARGNLITAAFRAKSHPQEKGALRYFASAPGDKCSHGSYKVFRPSWDETWTRRWK